MMFVLRRWNSKYGNAAQFVVEDQDTNKFTLFSPVNVNDVTWVDKDLSKIPPYKDWDDFGNTEVDYLENVIM